MKLTSTAYRIAICFFAILGLWLCNEGANAQTSLPTVVVDRDNVEITESCIIEIHERPLADADGNGVIHIKADNIAVEFTDVREHRELINVEEGTPWDTITGMGIVIDGYDNVTIRNAHSHRFKVGIYAKNADHLTLDSCDVAGGYAQRLGSTAEREDSKDWLWPHRNDDNEWMNNYGAAIYVEDSDNVTINDCYTRRRQNGIILDNVDNSKVYDNDCSFLSGWGLAMWRSNNNVISRNAFDFCIRGYSHGVYNRGQDSAGILMFEQNNNNVIAENSCTHGGDALFGFGGRDALGEVWMEKERERLRAATGVQEVDHLIKMPDDVLERFKRKGNNGNLLINNDFSYAAAHGIEMTFSFDNQFCNNKIVGSAICGVWGGYSQDTRIAGNLFKENGDRGYGLERGGVNIEHGRGNVIEWNEFKDNKCGVHLWWDPDEGLMRLPWAKINEDGSRDNSVTNNTFDGDEVALHVRETRDTIYVSNKIRNVKEEVRKGIRLEDQDTSNVIRDALLPMVMYSPPMYEAYGDNRPVGARPELAGRENIIMTEWFPWDHKEPLALRVSGGDPSSDEHEFQLYNIEMISSTLGSAPDGDALDVSVGDYDAEQRRQSVYIACPEGHGVFPFAVLVDAGEFSTMLEGVFVKTEWEITVFPWTIDPRDDRDGWYRESRSNRAMKTTRPDLNLRYAGGGPSQVDLSPDIRDAGLAPDRFGTIATTRLQLGPGVWRVKTVSDDGIRVRVNGNDLIDNWTWHPPTEDTAVFRVKETEEVEFVVEHFEIDGYAMLEFHIERVEDQ